MDKMDTIPEVNGTDTETQMEISDTDTVDTLTEVNGQDLSKASHEDAVEAFRTAKEPIVVEVLRRVTKGSACSPPGGKMKTPKSPSMVTVSTQTDGDEFIDADVDDAYYFLQQASTSPGQSPPALCSFINSNGSLLAPASRHGVAFSPTVDLGLTDIEMANVTGWDVDDAFDADTFADIEYDEVTLVRGSTEEKVGLTLCYGSADDEITDIFVQEIEPFSIAHNNGHIREGDQILQINGVDVQTRDQAIRLFSENSSQITLLLARQVLQMDDGYIDERNGLTDLHLLEQRCRHDGAYTANILTAQGNNVDEEGGTTDTATTENSNKHGEKDSGVGRTDDSNKDNESSEQELLDNDCASPGNTSHKRRRGGGSDHGNHHHGNNGSDVDLHCSNDSFTSSNNDGCSGHAPAHNEISAEDANKFRAVLETRCRDDNTKPTTTGASVAAASKLTRNNSQSSIEREIAALNREMEQIQLECQEIVDMHVKEQSRLKSDAVTAAATTSAAAVRSPRMVPRMGTRLDYIRQLHALQHIEHSDFGPTKEVLANGHIYERVGPPAGPPPPPHKADKVRCAAMDRMMKEKDTASGTTSAYNTGDSCRSTPGLTMELGADPRNNNSMLCLPLKPPSHSDSEKLVSATLNGAGSKEWNSDGDAAARINKSVSSTSVSRMSQTGDVVVPVAPGAADANQQDSLQELYAQYADVMYTNRENLQHTIMVQQKLFQQQLMQQRQALAAAGKDSTSSHGKPPPLPPPNGSTGSPSHHNATNGSSSPSHHHHHHRNGGGGGSGSAHGSPSHQQVVAAAGTSEETGGTPTMEYVVKRRADGTRYIARRPVRSKLLKERARKINEERCGMTTDDDAMSEMKVGRYWNKVERKRHLEKAKQRKEKAKAKMETLKEDAEHAANSKEPVQPNIVELSHRKMMRHKGKKVFDDFTTIQEMMVHGARDPQTGKAYNPLLSVTTV